MVCSFESGSDSRLDIDMLSLISSVRPMGETR